MSYQAEFKTFEASEISNVKIKKFDIWSILLLSLTSTRRYPCFLCIKGDLGSTKYLLATRFSLLMLTFT